MCSGFVRCKPSGLTDGRCSLVELLTDLSSFISSKNW